MADDNDPEILFRRARKHAKAQARSNAKRKANNVPRRDDLARCGYYVLLLALAEIKSQPEIEMGERIRGRMEHIMRNACFDPEASMRTFEDHAETVIKDVKTWVAGRRIAQRQRLEAEAARSAAE